MRKDVGYREKESGYFAQFSLGQPDECTEEDPKKLLKDVNRGNESQKELRVSSKGEKQRAPQKGTSPMLPCFPNVIP